eukprot:2414447-Karenia_brevis.AAC.1
MSSSSTSHDGGPPPPPWRPQPKRMPSPEAQKKALLMEEISAQESLIKHRAPNMKMAKAVLEYTKTENNHWDIGRESVESVLERWEAHVMAKHVRRVPNAQFNAGEILLLALRYNP